MKLSSVLDEMVLDESVFLNKFFFRGAPKGGGPRTGGGPKVYDFFFTLPPQFSFFSPSLVGRFRGFLVVFEALGP